MRPASERRGAFVQHPMRRFRTKISDASHVALYEEPDRYKPRL